MTSPSASLLPDEVGDPEFVDAKPDRHYICTLCNRVLRSAVQTYCGHRFCEQCIILKIHTSGDPMMCPAGEEDCLMLSLRSEDEKNFSPDYSARRDITRFKVRCINKDNGCQEVMKFGELPKHLEICPYQQVPCLNREQGCMESIPKLQLEGHLLNCPFRLVQCSQCLQPVSYNRQKEHLDNDCPNQRRPCPYCHLGSFTTNELRTVHMSDCPKQPKPCSFQILGCPDAVPEDSTMVHERDKMLEHLSLVPGSFSSLKEENVWMREQLIAAKEEIARLQNDHKSDLEGMELKVKGAQKQVVKYGERVNKLEEQITHVPTHDERLRRLETLEGGTNDRGGGGGGGIIDDKAVKLVEIRLNEMESRLSQMYSMSYDGVLIWKIMEYSRKKKDAKEGRNLSLYSQPFYTSRYGYKMRARAYLNGDGAGKHNSLSLFFVIMRGEYDALLDWPFKLKVTLMLLDQKEGAYHLSDTFRPDIHSSSFKRPATDMNIASGCPKFATHEVVESGSVYLRDDTIFVKVVVDTSYLKYP